MKFTTVRLALVKPVRTDLNDIMKRSQKLFSVIKIIWSRKSRNCFYKINLNFEKCFAQDTNCSNYFMIFRMGDDKYRKN